MASSGELQQPLAHVPTWSPHRHLDRCPGSTQPKADGDTPVPFQPQCSGDGHSPFLQKPPNPLQVGDTGRGLLLSLTLDRFQTGQELDEDNLAIWIHRRSLEFCLLYAPGLGPENSARPRADGVTQSDRQAGRNQEHTPGQRTFERGERHAAGCGPQVRSRDHWACSVTLTHGGSVGCSSCRWGGSCPAVAPDPELRQATSQSCSLRSTTLAGQPGHSPQLLGTTWLWFHREALGSRKGQGSWGKTAAGREAEFCMGDLGEGTTGSGGTVVPNIAEPKGRDALLKNNNLF